MCIGVFMLKKIFVWSTMFSLLLPVNFAHATLIADILRLQDDLSDLNLKLGKMARRHNITKGNILNKSPIELELENQIESTAKRQKDFNKEILELQAKLIEIEMSLIMSENSANEY